MKFGNEGTDGWGGEVRLECGRKLIETGPEVGEPMATHIVGDGELLNADTRYARCEEIVHVALAEKSCMSELWWHSQNDVYRSPFCRSPIPSGQNIWWQAQLTAAIPVDKCATTLDGFSRIFHNFIWFNIHILSERNWTTPTHSHIVTGFRQVIDRFRMISDA